MIEKVNKMHPDKIADRIAGALVDLAYKQDKNPKIAVEVLIGHGVCHIIAETSVNLNNDDVKNAVNRIAGNVQVDLVQVAQDVYLSSNQEGKIRCGDNGIFKGMPLTEEQKTLSFIVRDLYEQYPTDGKYILSNGRLIACQSNANKKELEEKIDAAYTSNYIVNPLGDWTGGTDVDTGGGLHGKDLSKADVSVNIYAFLKAQKTGKPIELCCAIGDEFVDGLPYAEVVRIAREYIKSVGGFEKFAEWGLY